MSIYNNQTGNPTSYFYNWDGVSQWDLLFASRAPDLEPDIRPYEDVIDGVKVC